MMMRGASLLVLFTLAGAFCFQSAHASRPIPAHDRTIYSSDRKFYLHLVPKTQLMLHGVCEGETTAYKTATKTKLWAVPIYCTDSVLGNDGKKMVVVYPPGREEDLAIAFYNNGKLLKSYRIKDFPGRAGAPRRIVGGGRAWRCMDVRSFSQFSEDQALYFVVLDDMAMIVFDTKSGGIVTRQSTSK